MRPQQLAVLVVVATLGLLVVLLLVYGRPRRSAQEPPPANFAKGDPDSVLEGSRLQKILIWGLASALFIAGFLVLYSLVEPFREARWTNKFQNESVERGHFEFNPAAFPGNNSGANCAACHGPQAQGGFASTDPSWPAPPLNNVLSRYTKTEVTRIIKMGRPGTPMPTWGVEFGGPLNDQKVDDVVNYLESIQVAPEAKWELPQTVADGPQVFSQKCAVCHGPNAGGQAMGRPLPSFYAPDLTTEFYRLGSKVLAERSKARGDTSFDIKAVPVPQIMAAGEEAARNTIVKGRPNTPMPSWQNRIRPEQIDAVVAWLKSIQRMPS